MGKHDETGDRKKDSDQVCFSKRSQTEVHESSGLPKGLVGPASTVEVKLNGCLCQALLDRWLTSDHSGLKAGIPRT